MASNDLLIRVDAQVTQFNAAMGSASRETLQLEAALKRAALTQAQFEKQLATSGAAATSTLAAQARAQQANAALAEKSAAMQTAALAKQQAAYQSAGRGMVLAGGAIALGLGVAAHAAIEWQKDFQGVARVTGATGPALDKLEGQLRGLAKTLPATHEEITTLATSASQLGVSTGNLTKFTTAMVELGATSTLSADDAATGLAKLSNITKTPTAQIENLGSALLEMGQNGASSESDILGMSLRIAAAGHAAGLSVTDVLALSNTLSSLGVEAEAGGTAVSQTIALISKSAVEGGEKLKTLAEVSGLSAKAFKDLVKSSPVDALGKFAKGLDGINKSGGDVYGTLQGLGVTGVRQIRSLLLLGSGFDTLKTNVDNANGAFEDGTKLQDQAANAFESTAAKLQIASNQVHDFGIDIGTVLLPAIGDLAEKGSDLVRVFSELPEPIKQAIGYASLFAAGIGILGGAALLASTKFTKLKTSVSEMAASSGTGTAKFVAMRAGFGALGVAAGVLASKVDDSNTALKGTLELASGIATGFAVGGPIGAAIGGAAGVLGTLASASANAAKKQADLNAIAGTLADTLDRQSQSATKATFAAIASGLSDVSDEANNSFVAITTLAHAAGGQTAAMQSFADSLHISLADLQSLLDIAKGAQSAGSDISSETVDNMKSVKGLFDSLPDVNNLTDDQYKLISAVAAQSAGLDAATKSARLNYEANHIVGSSLDDLGPKAAAAAAGADTFVDSNGNVIQTADAADKALKAELASFNALRDAALGAVEGEIGFRNAIRAAQAQAKESTAGLFAQTEAADKNKSIVDAAISSWNSLDASVSGTTKQYEAHRKELIDVAAQFTKTRAQAAAYVDGLAHIPKSVESEILADDADALGKIKDVIGGLFGVDHTHATATISVLTAGAFAAISAVQSALNNITGVSAGVSVPTGTGTGTGKRKNHALGGPVFGQAGIDKVPALLTNREWVMPTSSVDHYGPSFMAAVQHNRFAGGGQVGGTITLEQLLRILARPAPFATVGGVNVAARDRAKEARDVGRAEDALHEARQRVNDVTHKGKELDRLFSKAQSDASDANSKYRDTLKQVTQLQHDGKPVSAALLAKERELKKARDDARTSVDNLRGAEENHRKAMRDAEKAERQAQKDLERQQQEAADAAQKLHDKRQALIEQDKAWAEAVTSQTALFGGSGTAVSAQGLLAKLRSGNDDASEFRKRLAQLSRLGLNKEQLREFRDEGPTAEALELMGSLVSSKSLIDAINRAVAHRDHIADQIGTFGTGGHSGRSHGRGNGHGIAAGDGVGGRQVIELNDNATYYAYDPNKIQEARIRRERQALAIALQ